MEGFGVKVEKQQEIGHLIQNNWTHVEQLLDQVNKAVESMSWEGVKSAVKEIEWIQSVDAAQRSFIAFLPDEEGKPAPRVCTPWRGGAGSRGESGGAEFH